jgi:hypothetical protein
MGSTCKSRPEPCCDNETWQDVPGYAGLYEVSSCGRVWSMPRWLETKAGVHKPIKGRLMLLHTSSGAYTFCACRPADSIRRLNVGRLVLTLFEKAPPWPHAQAHPTGPAAPHLFALRWETKAGVQRV